MKTIYLLALAVALSFVASQTLACATCGCQDAPAAAKVAESAEAAVHSHADGTKHAHAEAAVAAEECCGSPGAEGCCVAEKADKECTESCAKEDCAKEDCAMVKACEGDCKDKVAEECCAAPGAEGCCKEAAVDEPATEQQDDENAA
jgi:hypothetical protein